MLFKDFTVNQNFNLNMTGGGRKVGYFLNASVLNENGIIRSPLHLEVRHQHQFAEIPFPEPTSAPRHQNDARVAEDEHPAAFQHRPVEEVKDLFYYTMRANPVAFPAIYPKGSVEDLDDPICARETPLRGTAVRRTSILMPC